ncbi:MAG: MOSC N-terminal beta barrel domain-containing protein [Solirubrobacterales bacterium]
MKITALQTTPVKGAMLDHPATIEIGPHGVATNRRFFLIDDRGLMFNGKRNGRLARVQAAYDPESGRLSLELPGGRRSPARPPRWALRSRRASTAGRSPDMRSPARSRRL